MCRSFRYGYSEEDSRREYETADPGLLFLADVLQGRTHRNQLASQASPFIVLNFTPPQIPIPVDVDTTPGAEFQQQLDSVAQALTEAFNRVDSIAPASFRAIATDAVNRIRASTIPPRREHE
ncbi:MAG: hypothetical protein CMI16_06485 [Opitutaceae bacterium]|nr:hypothetical protein [Opitutaceae bacterium]